jgi:hypothetical protein
LAVLVSASASASLGWAAGERPALDELKWLEPGADATAFLTTAPAECLAMPEALESAGQVRLGRIAFRSPVLLGGIAGRVGLSCDSCHRNGHGNPHFFVVGVSGAPGTADVTGSVFSTTRDDHVNNPVEIPSLVDAAAHPPFGTVVPAKDLSTFLHHAIIDEFQGQTPPRRVLDGLADYLRLLERSACPGKGASAVSKITFEADARRLLEMMDTLSEVVAHADVATSDFVLLSLRSALGRVYHRFPAAISERDALIQASRSLSRLRPLFPETDPARMRSEVAIERARLEKALDGLRPKETRSFYDASVLSRALESAN